MLSVRLRFKDSDYPFGVFKLFFWPLCCVRLRYTDSNYPVGVFKLFFSPLCCLLVFDIRILTTTVVSSNTSFDHCVVSSSSIYDSHYPFGVFKLLLTIVLSVRLRYKDSDYPCGVFKHFFWPLCCLFVFDIKILTTPLDSFDHTPTPGVFNLFFWPLCCLFVFDLKFWLPLWCLQTLLLTIVLSVRLRYTFLTTPVVSSNSSFDHCVVCSSLIYGFWLPLWCLQTLLLTIVLSVRLRCKDSDYPFSVFKLFFWPLCCRFVFDITILTTPLVSSNSSFDHCVVCSSLIYGFWLPLWCLQTLLLTIVLSVRLRCKDSDYPFSVFKLFFWPLCCLFVFDIKILTTSLVSSNSSFDHCVVCSSSIYGFWLRLWCLQTLLLTIVLSVRLRYKDSDYPLVSSISSFDHCVVCSSSI